MPPALSFPSTHTSPGSWGQGQNWHPDLVLPRPGSFPEKTGCLHQVFQKQKQLSQQLAGSCSGEWGGRRDTSQGGYCQETQGRRLGREETWNSFLSVPSVSPGFQNQWPAWCLCWCSFNPWTALLHCTSELHILPFALRGHSQVTLL